MINLRFARIHTLVSALLLSIWLSAPAGFAQICGDCDANGVISVLDALNASQVAVGVRPFDVQDLEVCDIDLSLSIDVLDALRIAQSAAGLVVVLTCPPARIPVVTMVTPAAPQSGDILIQYVAADPDSEAISIDVAISTDGGLSYPLYATSAVGGDGITGLSTNPTGILHTFAWDSLSDVGAVAALFVAVQITPYDTRAGAPGFSTVFIVDNRLPGVVSFALDLRPIFDDITPSGVGCVNCHSGAFPPAGLDLTDYGTLMAGSGAGVVVIPGDPMSSRIVCKVEGTFCGAQMPLTGTPWTPAMVQLLSDWITQGALDN